MEIWKAKKSITEEREVYGIAIGMLSEANACEPIN